MEGGLLLRSSYRFRYLDWGRILVPSKSSQLGLKTLSGRAAIPPAHAFKGPQEARCVRGWCPGGFPRARRPPVAFSTNPPHQTRMCEASEKKLGNNPTVDNQAVGVFFFRASVICLATYHRMFRVWRRGMAAAQASFSKLLPFPPNKPQKHGAWYLQ